MTAIVPSPLITATALLSMVRAGDPLVVLDVRWSLGAVDPRGEFDDGHIPGAVYVDLESELAGAPDPSRGRHPLPSTSDVVRVAGRWGAEPDSVVVVYDDNGGMSAARAWWLLRWVGHERVHVLDGGLAAWRAAGGPVVATSASDPRADAQFAQSVNGVENRTPPRSVRIERRSSALGTGGAGMPIVDADVIAGGQVDVLLDARSAARYRGEQEPVDPVAGHIPGAVSAPTTDNLGTDGRFLDPEELRSRFERLGVRTDASVAVYCGSGVTAAHEVLALELAGVRAALYPESWSGWISDPSRPVATGDNPFT